MQRAAAHGHGVLCGKQLRAHFPQLLLHGGDTVAFLHAQARGVADDRLAFAQRAQHHQHRPQIGTVRKVDLRPPQGAFFKQRRAVRPDDARAAARQDIQYGPVALQRILPQARDGHAAPGRAQNRQKRGLGIIALHRVRAGAVRLPAGHGDGVFIRERGPHAEIGQRTQRQVHITAALERRRDSNDAGAGKQRKSKQQPADELAADVSRQRIFPGGQRAAHRNPVCVLRKAEAPLRKHPRIYALRTLHQPPSPGKAYRRVREGKEWDEKPQRAAAFAAIHRAGHRRKGQAARSF